MLVCNKCKSPLQIKTNHIVLSNFFVNFNGVKLTELEIVSPDKLTADYFCPNCNENKSFAELETKCYLCSKFVSIIDAVVVKNRGNYHQSCAKEYFDNEPTESLLKLLEKGISKNE